MAEPVIMYFTFRSPCAPSPPSLCPPLPPLSLPALPRQPGGGSPTSRGRCGGGRFAYLALHRLMRSPELKDVPVELRPMDPADLIFFVRSAPPRPSSGPH